MVYLSPNTANQRLYLTLFEARYKLPTFTNYLVELRKSMTSEAFYFVANVVMENSRYTEINVGTNISAPTAGNILLVDSGDYIYTIYGQNSSTNLDPANTEGIAEVGVLNVLGTGVYFVEDTEERPIDLEVNE